MTDLSVTAGSVTPGANARLDYGVAGEAITPLQPVYKAADGKWYKSDSNAGTDLIRAATAVSVVTAAANQPITVQKSGKVNCGSILTKNIPYFLSDTAGGICPIADVGSGEYGCLIGIGLSATELLLILAYTGAAN